MKLKVVEIEKKVKILTGEEVTRKGKVTFPVPESLEEAQELYGDNLWKWAVQGSSTHFRVTGTNAVSGGNPELKALRRQFTQAYESFTKIMGMSAEETLTLLISKPTFTPLADEIAAMKDASKVTDVVFVAGSLPEPRWFGGDVEPEDESAEEESAKS